MAPGGQPVGERVGAEDRRPAARRGDQRREVGAGEADQAGLGRQPGSRARRPAAASPGPRRPPCPCARGRGRHTTAWRGSARRAQRRDPRRTGSRRRSRAARARAGEGSACRRGRSRPAAGAPRPRGRGGRAARSPAAAHRAPRRPGAQAPAVRTRPPGSVAGRRSAPAARPRSGRRPPGRVTGRAIRSSAIRPPASGHPAVGPGLRGPRRGSVADQKAGGDSGCPQARGRLLRPGTSPRQPAAPTDAGGCRGAEPPATVGPWAGRGGTRRRGSSGGGQAAGAARTAWARLGQPGTARGAGGLDRRRAAGPGRRGEPARAAGQRTGAAQLPGRPGRQPPAAAVPGHAGRRGAGRHLPLAGPAPGQAAPARGQLEPDPADGRRSWSCGCCGTGSGWARATATSLRPAPCRRRAPSRCRRRRPNRGWCRGSWPAWS